MNSSNLKRKLKDTKRKWEGTVEDKRWKEKGFRNEACRKR